MCVCIYAFMYDTVGEAVYCFCMYERDKSGNGTRHGISSTSGDPVNCGMTVFTDGRSIILRDTATYIVLNFWE